jgi:hypothetical protein
MPMLRSFVKYTFYRKSISFLLSFTLIVAVALLAGCRDNDVTSDTEPIPDDSVTTLEPSAVDISKIYIPVELQSINLYKSSSTWYYGRSKQSDHFIVFWGAGYKDKDPGSAEVPETYRVNIDDLLAKAESFYDLNITKLKFAEVGTGKSNLDRYKMMIFVYYQSEWLATGSGYDNKIGALWVSPSTCKPVGSVIAHEIGHSFQYQVFCDLKGSSGFRYGFGGKGGNAFWEQTAQWQSYQSYPDQAFTDSDFGIYTENYSRHICHEAQRYASYFIHYYWADKHGRDIIGRIWREAKEPEDPLQAYMRITNITNAHFNEEIYDAATRFVTWDLDAIRDTGADYIGAHTFKYTTLDDRSYQVAYDRCPGTTGYNVVRLNVPSAGTSISAAFTGLVNASGFNHVEEASRAGWRYGYVALLKNGVRTYSEMYSGTNGTATFTVPENCSKLWFVVTGAPDTYAPHPWDDDNSNDDQWPYKVKFKNTDLYGNVTFDGTETPQNVTLTYDISFPFSATVYPGTTVTLDDDIIALAKAFVLQPGEITSSIGNSIKLYAVESNGTLNANTTANNGHWFNTGGNVCAWGGEARVFSEFNGTALSFAIGQYPGQCAVGNKYTIKQALVYEYESGKTVQATFVFNITLL